MASLNDQTFSKDIITTDVFLSTKGPLGSKFRGSELQVPVSSFRFRFLQFCDFAILRCPISDVRCTISEFRFQIPDPRFMILRFKDSRSTI